MPDQEDAMVGNVFTTVTHRNPGQLVLGDYGRSCAPCQTLTMVTSPLLVTW